jgi:hypothetical protein
MIPLWTADGSQQNSVARSRGFDGGRGKRLAEFIDRKAAHRSFNKVKRMPETRAYGAQDFLGGRRYFGTYSVSRDGCDFISHFRCFSLYNQFVY